MQSDNKGFSLIEMLISIAIAGMIIVAALSVVMYGMNNYSSTAKETKLQGEIQFTGNIISDAIKQGKASASMISIVRDAEGKVAEAKIYTQILMAAEKTPYYDTEGKVVSQKQVLYYNASKDSIYLYESGETIGDGDEDHLVSNCIEKFDVGYEQTKAAEPVGNDIAPAGSAEEQYCSESSLVRFDITYKVSSRTRSTQTKYKFRNQ